MRSLSKVLILLLAFALGTAPAVLADKSTDRDKTKKEGQSPTTASKTNSLPEPGSCLIGHAQKDLDVNNVRSRVFNTGSLAYGNGAEAQYVVPKASGHSPIYAQGIWVGGLVNGELRTAAATYSDFEFWPGPLGPDGRPVNPNDCSQYDRIWKVGVQDIQTYEATGIAAPDLAEWPVDLGAPVIDGDGVEGNYNLAGGDRPELIGDQAVWWIMNDVGNAHNNTETPPIGIEVRVHGFAFNRADALGNTTFYKYSITYKGDQPLTDAYLSIFSDPDLGDAGDDYVGVDTTLSLGFVYNSTPTDAVYGAAPAAGYDFFQGPVSADGDTLGVTSFFYFINSGPAGTEDPGIGEEFYNIMRGFWSGGEPLTASGLGYQTSGPITKFAYPGDPVTEQYWSEVNNDGSGADNQAGDRRLVMTTGPFTISPGESQDIVFGVVFAQGSDNLSSISALRAADVLAQSAYDADFDIPTPPPAPPRCNPLSDNPALKPGSGQCLYAAELDGEAALVWGYPTNSLNYLGRYDVADPFLSGLGLEDTTYTFEGFNIYRYPTQAFSPEDRELVATFDRVNGVTKVTDLFFDPALGDFAPRVTALGTDSGIQYSFPLNNLTNYQDYYYGVSAYAYSPNSTPKILESSPSNITVRPSSLALRGGGSRTQSEYETTFTSAQAVNQVGQGIVQYRVVDPTNVTGSTYRVEFYDLAGVTGPEGEDGAGVTTYSIVRTSDDAVVLSGRDYFARTGEALPQGENVFVADGLSFTVTGPEPGFNNFLVVQNAAGPLNPPEYGAFAFNASGFPHPTTEDRPSDRQQATTDGLWGIHAGGAGIPYGPPSDGSSFLGRATRGGANLPEIGAYDYEIRFTYEDDNYAIRAFQDGALMPVPFEVWNTGIGTPDDPSDDYRLIPLVFDDGEQMVFDITGDHAISGGANDPMSDWVYFYTAEPFSNVGEEMYNDFMFGDAGYGHEILARLVLVNWNGGEAPPYTAALPEEGTVFRIVTDKPHLPGDVFEVNTAGKEFVTNDQSLLEESLDEIGVVPNPYKGVSAYETSNQDRRVRFTNLPTEVTIRIYTVSGTLIRTLQKDGPGATLDWNLATEDNLPVASGMYFIHVDVPGVGERVLKFGVINRETNINVF